MHEEENTKPFEPNRNDNQQEDKDHQNKPKEWSAATQEQGANKLIEKLKVNESLETEKYVEIEIEPDEGPEQEPEEEPEQQVQDPPEEQEPEEENESEQPEDDYIIYDEPVLQGQQSSMNANHPYKVISIEDVINKLDRVVKSLSGVLECSLDWALLFLRECHWDKQRCEDNFFSSQERLFERCGYTPKPYEMEDMNGKCSVCLEQGPNKYITLGCGHCSCETCWRGYVQEQLSIKVVFFKCMNENCNVPVPRSLIERMLEDDKRKAQKFLKGLGDKFLECNPTMKFCPGADCDKCLCAANATLKEVRCDCGTRFCFGCCLPIHRPCECTYVTLWKESVMGDQANEKWIALNTKTCPFCKRHVQRSEGCNFMACRPPGGCGESFCYVCSKPWLPDHKDHFNCNVRKEQERLDEEEKMRLERLKAERIEFYCEKYISNQTCAEQLVKNVERSQKIREWLYDVLNISLTDSEFIPKVYQFAIEACGTLKWAYVFRYFLDDKSAYKDVFQLRQGDFERFKENLLFKLSTKLMKLYEESQEKLEKGLPLDREGKAKEFREIRQEILSFYKTAEDFMKVLIDTVEKEMP